MWGDQVQSKKDARDRTFAVKRCHHFLWLSNIWQTASWPLSCAQANGVCTASPRVMVLISGSASASRSTRTTSASPRLAASCSGVEFCCRNNRHMSVREACVCVLSLVIVPISACLSLYVRLWKTDCLAVTASLSRRVSVWFARCNSQIHGHWGSPYLQRSHLRHTQAALPRCQACCKGKRSGAA